MNMVACVHVCCSVLNTDRLGLNIHMVACVCVCVCALPEPGVTRW